VLPILPARPALEAPQDVRSASRTPGAQLPEPSIRGTRPRITGPAAADPRQDTRSFPQYCTVQKVVFHRTKGCFSPYKRLLQTVQKVVSKGRYIIKKVFKVL